MLLVDTYNVLSTVGVLPPRLASPGVPGLVQLIEHSRYRDLRARLVCDGRPGEDLRGRGGLMTTDAGLSWCRLGRTEVVFSGPSREADDVIEEVLDRSTFANRFVVVSSDRRVARAAGRAGADTVASAAFLGHLVEDESRPSGDPLPAFVSDVPLDHYSVLHWMREFGFEPDDSAGNAPSQVDRPSPPKPKRIAKKPRRAESSGDADGNLPRAPIQPPVPAEPVTDDPLLAEAFREWAGRLSLEDLEMDRWVDGVEQLKRRGR